MKRIGLFFILLAALLAAFQTVHAQNDQPLALVMTADGPIMPPMLEYIRRGIQVAERRNAEVLIITAQVEMGVAIRMACLEVLTRRRRGVEGWSAVA